MGKVNTFFLCSNLTSESQKLQIVSSCQVVFNLTPSTNSFDVVINSGYMKRYPQVVAIFKLGKPFATLDIVNIGLPVHHWLADTT